MSTLWPGVEAIQVSSALILTFVKNDYWLE